MFKIFEMNKIQTQKFDEQILKMQMREDALQQENESLNIEIKSLKQLIE